MSYTVFTKLLLICIKSVVHQQYQLCAFRIIAKSPENKLSWLLVDETHPQYKQTSKSALNYQPHRRRN
jgi:hypothetical protein